MRLAKPSSIISPEPAGRRNSLCPAAGFVRYVCPAAGRPIRDDAKPAAERAPIRFTLTRGDRRQVILSAALLVFMNSSRARSTPRGSAGSGEPLAGRNALALATTLTRWRPRTGFWLGHTASAGMPSTSASWHLYPEGGEGRFTVALFRVILDFPDNREFAPVEVTKLGYLRENEPGSPPNEPAR